MVIACVERAIAMPFRIWPTAASGTGHVVDFWRVSHGHRGVVARPPIRAQAERFKKVQRFLMLSTGCAIFSDGFLKKPPLKIVFLEVP
jgi:hypothetical protein